MNAVMGEEAEENQRHDVAIEPTDAAAAARLFGSSVSTSEADPAVHAPTESKGDPDADANCNERADPVVATFATLSTSTSSTANGSTSTTSCTTNVKVCSVSDEVITRGKRSGSLSKFVDENDLYRRKSLHGANSSGNGSLEELMASMTAEDDPLAALSMACAYDQDDPDYKDKQPQDHAKSVANFLAMPIDSILEIIDDKDSEFRFWLLQPEIVREILNVFIRAPSFELPEGEEPNEEYGFYKDYFVCSEIIMKLYTGEDDLYESFSSDSSDGSSTSSTCGNNTSGNGATANGPNSNRTSLHGGTASSVHGGSSGPVFGCQNDDELERWRLLFSLFDDPNRIPLDEMQLLFYSKVIVRLHDSFCLEDGYVQNVLRPFLPKAIGHLYSNTIKFMLVLILQSYESVHPITGRNDAMEILAPVLARATRLLLCDENSEQMECVDPEHWRFALVENAATLLVDMLQANQADRLGSFVRKECGVLLSKYFVRDQFGTIRGFESVQHGYHNFLQFMVIEELGKNPAMIRILFENALFEIQEWSKLLAVNSSIHVSSVLNIATTCEMMSLLLKIQEKSSSVVTSDELGNKALAGEACNSPVDVTEFNALGMVGGGSSYGDSYGGNAVVLYDLKTCCQLESFCQGVLEFARATAAQFVQLFHQRLSSTIQIALAKHLHSLVLLNDAKVNEILHQEKLTAAYFRWLCEKPRFDMLHVHTLPAMVFILKDQDMTRDKDCPLTRDLMMGASKQNGSNSNNQQDDDQSAPTASAKAATGLLSFIVEAFETRSQCRIHATLLHQTISEIFESEFPSENNLQVVDYCEAHDSYRAFREEALKKRKSRYAADEEDAENEVAPDASAVGSGSFKELSELESSNQLQEQEERETSIHKKTKKDVGQPREEPAQRRESLKSQEDNNEITEKPLETSPRVDNNSNHEDTSMTSPLPPPPPPPSEDNTRRGYFRNMLHPIRKNSFKNSPKSQENQPQPEQGRHSDKGRNSDKLSTTSPTTTDDGLSSKWRHVFKRIKNSVTLATGGTASPSSSPTISKSPSASTGSSTNSGKKTLALSGPFANANEVLVVDTTRGDDITNFVYHNGGVHVAKMVSSRTQKVNTVTSGYMYRNRMPELGHRHAWERLYFVLDREQGTLCYYASETHARDRIFVRGTVRPTNVSEGIPVVAAGQHAVFGFQITTQGHGVFWVLVESEGTRSTWCTELMQAISAWNEAHHHHDSNEVAGRASEKAKNNEPNPAIALPASTNGIKKMGRAEMKQLVVELYEQLYGPQLRFTTPLEAPRARWLNSSKQPQLSCMADTVVLSSNLPECVPYWGEFHGYDRVCDYFRIREETIEKSSGRVLRIVVDEAEETIVVMTTTTYRILRNSEVVTEESCDVITVSNDQIVSIHCTFDSFTIAEAFMREGLNAS